MTAKPEDFTGIEEDPPGQLSKKELQAKRLNPNSNRTKKKTPLPVQTSKTPKGAVKIIPEEISTHFKWALILTIFCFFIIGPCWALYKTFALRRMIERKELADAEQLSNRISSVLVICTVIGIFLWVAILFCSVGIILTGKLIDANIF